MDNNNTCAVVLAANEEFVRLRSGIEHFIQPVSQRFGVTPTQVAVLNLIRSTESPTVSDLFRSLDLNQGNTSSLCKRLERDGLIERSRCSSDERKSYLRLTEKGVGVLSEIDRLFSPSEEEAWLSPEEEAEVRGALLTLIGASKKINVIMESYSKGKEKNDA